MASEVSGHLWRRSSAVGAWCPRLVAVALLAGSALGCRAEEVQIVPTLIDRPPGAACDDDYQCRTGNSCIDGVCLLADDERCAGDGECASGFCRSSVCARVGSGDPCSAELPCGEGFECVDEVCLLQDGEACGDHAVCVSGACVDDICTVVAPGDPCAPQGFCPGGLVCSEGLCVFPLGEACDRDAVCEGGHCVAEVCCESVCDAPCEQGCNAAGRCNLRLDGAECVDGKPCTASMCVGGECIGDTDMLCLGLTALVDVTESAGVAGVRDSAGDFGNAYGIAWGDYDGDGWVDLWLGGTNAQEDEPDDPPAHRGLLYRNLGEGRFARIEPAPQGGRAGAWADPDNDGDLDLFTSAGIYDDAGELLHASRVYVNEGASGFVRRTGEIGLDGANNLGMGAWIDVDADGWNDLFFPSGTDLDPNEPVNQIRMNVGGETLGFEAYTDAGLQGGQSNGETCAVADVDNDGDVDIWYNDDVTGSLFLNGGLGSGGEFLGFTQSAGDAGLEIDMGVGDDRVQPYYAPVFGDYNNDGWLDLFLGLPAGIDNRLYTNVTTDPGSPAFFLEGTPAMLNVDLGHSRGAAWGDYDNDGDLDLLVGNEANDAEGGAGAPAPNALYENRGVDGFVDVADDLGLNSPAPTATLAVSFADVDNDGDLDILFGNPAVANVLWENQLDDQKFLRVKAVGRGGGFSARDGIGTRVELWDAQQGELLAIREVSGGEGYGLQPPAIVHFGLAARWGGGDGSYVVRARFVSGAVVSVPGVVPVDEILFIGGTPLANTVVVEEP